eukprot:309778-Pleurochrysis_carterae.AAC.1
MCGGVAREDRGLLNQVVGARGVGTGRARSRWNKRARHDEREGRRLWGGGGSVCLLVEILEQHLGGVGRAGEVGARLGDDEAELPES